MAMRRLSRADRDLLGLMTPVLSVRRHHPGPGRRPAPVPDPGPVRCLTNRTAPIETSSGPRVWHRLNPRATGSSTTRCTSSPSPRSAHETPGRAYLERKLADGKSKKEALRALKRCLSDAVWRQLQVDLERL
jgi:hypothetical protein